MSVPMIPPPTPEARKAWPQTPVQSFLEAPLPDCQGPFDEAIAEGAAGIMHPMSPRIAEAKAVMESPAGYGAFSIQDGESAGWPTDMTPPPYETPLHPGPHGG
jgi:hypothetical protein